jgi:hypothetical protein
MELLKELYRETRVTIPTREREAKKLIVISENILTLFMRILVTGLFLLATTGILYFIIGMISGEIDTTNASFGIY